jgi:heat shock protein HtpX
MGTPRPMIAALQRLGGMAVEPLPKSLASSGIAGGPGFMALFSSHPSMEERIAALSAQGR